MHHAPWLYRSFKRALTHLAHSTIAAPCDDEVLAFIALRSAILADLGLPASERNIDRLTLCALAGLSLSVFMRDVDVALPAGSAQGLFGICFENQPPVSASRSAVSASMRN